MAAGKFVVPGSAAAAGGGINYTVDVFTSSGTYTKPSDLDYAYVLMVSGGGGGTSGRRGAASSNRAGGASTNGMMVLAKFANADLTSTSSVTVGAAGTAGAARTSDNTSGAAGTAGGNTNFKHGSTFQISGGNTLSGATSIISITSQVSSLNLSANYSKILNLQANQFVLGTFAVDASTRGNASGTSPGVGVGAPFNATSAGGSITSANARNNAGTLAGFYDDANTLTDEITGTSPEANGVQPTSFYTFGQYLAKIFPWFDPADANYNVGRGGLGGGCGDLAGTIAGGTGAAALGYGAGGGGGGASTNGANSGAGGAGSGGIVIIINVLTT